MILTYFNGMFFLRSTGMMVSSSPSRLDQMLYMLSESNGHLMATNSAKAVIWFFVTVLYIWKWKYTIFFNYRESFVLWTQGLIQKIFHLIFVHIVLHSIYLIKKEKVMKTLRKSMCRNSTKCRYLIAQFKITDFPPARATQPRISIKSLQLIADISAISRPE